MTAAVQTLWAELIVGTLADAGVATCVVSPGSRSTPLVTALAADGRLQLPTIIDERAAAFFALGIARATGVPVAMVCTSGSAAAHYLPAIVEASEAGVPLIAITADRPPELQHCGASQTIDQIGLYGSFVRAAYDLGAPVASALALRAVRRTIVQAVAMARGPRPGPVHVDVPLRKPLEPASPSTDDERALAEVVRELRRPIHAHEPRLVAAPAGISALAAAIAAEPRGIVIAGAMPPTFDGDAVLALAARAGYPVLAEAGSQLRRPRDGVVAVDHFALVALVAGVPKGAPAPRLVIQLGAEPVAAGWSALANVERWVLADHAWRDPDSSASGVIVGDIRATCERVCEHIAARDDRSYASAWRDVEARMAAAIDRALVAHPRSEGAAIRAALDALPTNAIVQVGNSLPIRVIDHVSHSSARMVIAQRGAAGIDGLIASAAGATHRGAPVLLVLGDVSFAHDLGGLLAARAAKTPLAILVIDNGGGRIFGGLPIANVAAPSTFERYFVTEPHVDPVAVATALGIRAVAAVSPATVATAVADALTRTGPTVIHAPVSATGARDLRLTALELGATHG
jgi:2-succinyl-5-enolpyruvyl-6-hydroxy-3-cyclohexene-1-carboxylate synthase